METFYYVECGRMTMFNAWFPNLNNTKKTKIYEWLIPYIRNVQYGPICKREDCGYITELFDFRHEDGEQNNYEVVVENNEIDYYNESGPLDTYEQCVEWINDIYTEDTINNIQYQFQIQYQKISGEGEYYYYP